MIKTRGTKKKAMKKVLGIIGGMGPLATADLFRKIILRTSADSDHEHIHILVDCNTDIPDRTDAILHGGQSPLKELTVSANRLEKAGADILLMACNTAHYFYKEIAESVHIPLLHMLDETAAEISRRSLSAIGLLATDATIQTGLYHKALDAKGIEIILPSKTGQKALMDLIYKGVKAGNVNLDVSALLQELEHMRGQGAQVFVLGCTELPIAFEKFHIGFAAIDPTDVLAKAAVCAAGYPLKNAGIA